MTFKIGTPVIVNLGSQGELHDFVDHVSDEGHIYLMTYDKTQFKQHADGKAYPIDKCSALFIERKLLSIYR